MPSFNELLINSLDVLPDSVVKSDILLTNIEKINWTPMVGVKQILCNAIVRSSGDSEAYNVQMQFNGIDNPIGARPSLFSTPVRVRCSCEAFYFYYGWYDGENGALAGRGMKPYVRKTTTYPSRNPKRLPGMCKHIISLGRGLLLAGKVTKGDPIDGNPPSKPTSEGESPEGTNEFTEESANLPPGTTGEIEQVKEDISKGKRTSQFGESSYGKGSNYGKSQYGKSNYGKK